jgi:hypothetical protein
MVLVSSLLAISAFSAFTLCSPTYYLNHQNRQVETVSILTTAFLSLTTGYNPSYTVSIPVSLDGVTLPINSEGTTWTFVSVDTGVCVVDLANSSSIVLGGANALDSDIKPPQEVIRATCQ